ncbi:MAG: hypothetical protein CVU39_07100 [Chloroflexi bacterium HGW-Chloroflexi-10]|nr:MAG: hypothetical protein CVU39_07100 [Chloroflexi bacterium HGW-Chloroflexi-10]
MSEAQLTPSPNTHELLHTKLMVPRLHTTVIERRDLLTQLNLALSKKLTVVSAPTGFGKTTLVSTWIANHKFACAWVTLDVNDNDPYRFWAYVVSALRTIDASIGKTTLAALSTSQLPSFQSLLTPLINDFAQVTRPCVLVLDDYHVITSTKITESLSFFLQHLPECLHIVLTTRNDPDLPLPILRVREELVEINTKNLRFNQQEAELLLSKSLPANLSAAALAQLIQKTEGWAAGLRLVALSLQNSSPGNIEKLVGTFSGSDRTVADYLIKEVFESQPGLIQNFLLKTCFLNRLTGELCDAITGLTDGETLLAQLERENLFLMQLEHGRGRAWYRYNPLFAESIQALAQQRLGKAGVQSIFEKASLWFEYQKLLDDAIEAALTAKLFERSISLIEKFIDIYNLNEIHTLLRWMENIPQPILLQRPAACMIYAQVILFTSDRYAPTTMGRMQPYLQAAEEIWKTQGNDENVGTVLALRGMTLLWQGEFQKSLELVYQALEKMPESEIFWRGVSLLNAAGGELYAGCILSAQDKILEARALLGASQNVYGMLAATGLLSEIFLAQGDLALCVHLNQQIILEAVGDEAMLDDQGNAHLNLAHVAYEQNELKLAEQHARTAFDMGKQRANELLQSQAAGRLALVRVAKDQPLQALEELKTLAAELQNPLALQELHTTQALITVRTGLTDIPGDWQPAPTESLSARNERETFILVRWHIAKGKPATALEMLQPYLVETAESGRVRSQVEALLLEAQAYFAQSNLTQAIKPLIDALTLGNTKGLRRSFLDEGAYLATLLQAAVPRLPNRVLSLFATSLIHLFSPGKGATNDAHSNSIVLVEPLSQQEIRVLKLLVSGLSNGEIAAELVVSTNTVKTHVKSVYRKLDINSREEARIIAKELKLY